MALPPDVIKGERDMILNKCEVSGQIESYQKWEIVPCAQNINFTLKDSWWKYFDIKSKIWEDCVWWTDLYEPFFEEPIIWEEIFAVLDSDYELISFQSLDESYPSCESNFEAREINTEIYFGILWWIIIFCIIIWILLKKYFNR